MKNYLRQNPKYKKPHQTRSILLNDKRNIQLEDNIFGLSCIRDISSKFKSLCEENAKQDRDKMHPKDIKYLEYISHASDFKKKKAKDLQFENASHNSDDSDNADEEDEIMFDLYRKCKQEIVGGMQTFEYKRSSQHAVSLNTT